MSDVESTSDVELPVNELKNASERRNENLLGNLKQKRENLANKETFISIPGYDREPPILLAKYSLLEGPVVDNIGTKVSREVKGQWDRQVLMAVDTFIEACQGMYVDIGEGAKEPQEMTHNGKHIAGYNQDLCEALEYEAETARQVVFGLFANNEIAIMQHNVKLSMWMSNTSRQVDDDFLGLI